MADHTDESKPKVEGEAINIVVKDQSGNEVHFKIKTSTKLEKVAKAYCDKKGIAVDSVRFLFDGERVNLQSNPGDLGMEDQDVIDCVIEQVGGCWA